MNTIPERYSRAYIKEATDIIFREHDKPCPIAKPQHSIGVFES